MIVIRNVFRLKFGKAKEAVALMKEGLAIQKRVMAGQEFGDLDSEVARIAEDGLHRLDQKG